MVLVVLRCVWAAAADAGCRTLARADSMRSTLPTGHSEDAPLWIRSGNLSLRSTVLFGVVPSAFYFATGGDGWSGRIAYVIVYGYIFLFNCSRTCAAVSGWSRSTCAFGMRSQLSACRTIK